MMSAVWKLAIVAGLVAVAISFCGIYKVVNEIHRALNYADLVANSVNKKTLRLFKIFDKDDDGYLDIFEFQAATTYMIESGNRTEGGSDEMVSDNLIAVSMIIVDIIGFLNHIFDFLLSYLNFFYSRQLTPTTWSCNELHETLSVTRLSLSSAVLLCFFSKNVGYFGFQSHNTSSGGFSYTINS